MKGNSSCCTGFSRVQTASGRRLENQMFRCGRVSAWLAGAAESRLEMVPQRIEKVESAPGNGMAAVILDPLYLALGQRDRRRIPVAARLVAAGSEPGPLAHGPSIRPTRRPTLPNFHHGPGRGALLMPASVC